MRLSSSQINVLEYLVGYPEAIVIKTNHNDLQEVNVGATTVLYFKGQTLESLIKMNILINREGKIYIKNPEINFDTFITAKTKEQKVGITLPTTQMCDSHKPSKRSYIQASEYAETHNQEQCAKCGHWFFEDEM